MSCCEPELQIYDTTASKPELFVLSPLHPEGEPLSKVADEVCLATYMNTTEGKMHLNVKDGQVSVNTTNAVMSQNDKKYVYAGFANQTIYSCEVDGTSSNNENFDLCADLQPERAKLNFYLLMMNAVRVVFTKSLAFSTILTVRAALF